MNLALWGWPQFVYAGLVIFSTGLNLANHGKPREPSNFVTSFVSMSLVMWLLYEGGFWK